MGRWKELMNSVERRVGIHDQKESGAQRSQCISGTCYLLVKRRELGLFSASSVLIMTFKPPAQFDLQVTFIDVLHILLLLSSYRACVVHLLSDFTSNYTQNDRHLL